MLEFSALLADFFRWIEAPGHPCSGNVYREHVGPHIADAWGKVSALFSRMVDPLLTQNARYNIEPFFWSSSLNWIPSHFQEEIQPDIGDRKLPFSKIHHVFGTDTCRYHYHPHFLAVNGEPL